MQKIKRVDVASISKTFFALDLFFISVVMIPVAIATSYMPRKEGSLHPLVFYGIMVVIHPIGAAIVGAVAAALYNFMAPHTGGIRVELETTTD